MDTIFIEGIEFYGYHGASREEQAIGHRYSVDVELRCDTSRAGASDRLEDTIDYGAAAQLIAEAGQGEPCRLLEALADRMATALLREFPVDSVRLRVRKLHPPMPVIAAAAGLEIERSR